LNKIRQKTRVMECLKKKRGGKHGLQTLVKKVFGFVVKSP